MKKTFDVNPEHAYGKALQDEVNNTNANRYMSQISSNFEMQNYDETCIVYWYTKQHIQNAFVKTMADKERIVEMILSMPKATINKKTSDMWMMDASGLTVGDVNE